MYPPDKPEITNPKPQYKFKMFEKKYDFIMQKRNSLADGIKIYGGEAILKEPMKFNESAHDIHPEVMNVNFTTDDYKEQEQESLRIKRVDKVNPSNSIGSRNSKR